MFAVTEYRVIVDWMGDEVVTLADLFPASLRAICVGINPSPVSVDAGHYYQGRLGKLFFARLVEAGVLAPFDGFGDDAAMAVGMGFTDVVKRPTARANGISAKEMRYGAELLCTKLRDISPPVVIFPFKKAAEAIVGSVRGNGWIDATFAGARLFVMPGPYESKATAAATLATLCTGLPGA